MKREEILAAIESMTVLELAELVKELEEKFGVSAAAPVAVAAAPAAGAAAAAPPRRRPSLMSSSPTPAAKRSRSSRLCAKWCPAWA